MTAIPWRIRLSARAESDFRQIIAYTRDTFGGSQAMAYRAILRDALVALEHGPDIRGSVSRDEIFNGIRSYHVARRGHRGRHLILYRPAPDHRIDVLRILHDAMDISWHIPGDTEEP